MDGVHGVAAVPRLGGRRGGGRQEQAGDRVGQAVRGEGPDREVLRGPGRVYQGRRHSSGYFLPPHWHGSCRTP